MPRPITPLLLVGLQGILLVIFGLVVVHAPISVFFGSRFPEFELLIKAWKEVLMLVALVLAIGVALRNRPAAKALLRDKLLWVIGAYAALHLLLIPVFPAPLTQLIAGLMIDLRYLLFFVLVYVTVRLSPGFRRPALLVSAVGALVVLIFGLLQIFVLPKDILAAIGYGDETIAPYLTIDKNDDYVRINSTLRGPNPLGAYVMVVVAAALSYLVAHPRLRRTLPTALAAAIVVAAPAVLWASYSRSALLAAGLAVGFIVGLRFRKHFKLVPTAIVIGLVALVGLTGIYALRDTSFVQNVIVHRDPTEGDELNSNEGHIESLQKGTERAARQPLGAGIGSTGSASLLGDRPFILENQYLFIAHETGWAGLGLFGVILFMVLRRLWRRRSEWLPLGVLASGLGLSIIGILLPVWADDTVSLVWWGLAALALAAPRIKSTRRVLS